MKTRKSQRLFGDALTYLVFLFALVFFGGPLLWLLSLSIRDQTEIFITSLRLIPENPTFQNFSLAGGSVLAVVMLAIAMALTLIYQRLLRSEGSL